VLVRLAQHLLLTIGQCQHNLSDLHTHAHRTV
jgi:hypothetical protein